MLDGPIHKGIFPYVRSLPPTPNFPIMIYPAHVSQGLTFRNSVFCPQCIYVYFLWISEQTAIISLYIINLSVFITEAEIVYCPVRTGSLNATDPFRP